MPRWGMTVDLNQCVGCGTCVDVCEQRNHIPPGSEWRKLSLVPEDKNSSERTYMTFGCMHCKNPPCLEVCPTTATYKAENGIVDIDYDKCIGCGYCIVACPYLARSIVREDLTNRNLNQSKGDKSSDLIGICTKCNFCKTKVEKGASMGLTPGIDREATPECVNSCIANALQFGDLDDKTSSVSMLSKESNSEQFMKEMGLEPAVYFLMKR